MKMPKRLKPELEKLKDKAGVGQMRLQTFQIEESDMRALKSKAALQGSKMAEIVRKLIKDYIQK